MTMGNLASFRRVLFSATCLTAALASSPARASGGEPPSGSTEQPQIVTRDDVDPNAPAPAGAVDAGITGIGQMVVQPNANDTGMLMCTGTLINPRTVIFAAHCVNSRPAEAYGADGNPSGGHNGGTPIAFGFEANNVSAIRQWLGLDGGASAGLLHRTNLARSLFAVEQVWFDPRSLGPNSNGFMAADIALATLDTPAFDVPSWALLFSPLDGPTHATIAGYGASGKAGGAAFGSGAPDQVAIDWRRRAAENMISVLGSFEDRDRQVFGISNPLTNNLYMTSFSDPDPKYDPAAGKFDFGIFGDKALPNEGKAGGGDSGAPLIVDRKYDRPVVAGILSGESRFFPNQQSHNYGTHDLFQPLHLYWDVIAANNSYVYAGNVAGNGDWEDPAHWVQLLDPAYMIDVNGKLVNGVPNTPAQGIAAGGAKFGKICFLAACTDVQGTGSTGTSASAPTPTASGLPPVAFVPDNVTARPKDGVKARYYDVTLGAAGTTRLATSATVDRMSIDGPAKLDIRDGGSLRVVGEYTQLRGWTHVDGALRSERDMLFLTGLLSGSGTVTAPFVTVVGAGIAPGGDGKVGTLNVTGNLILSSGSMLFVDTQRGSADRLTVDGTLSLSGAASGGGSVMVGRAAGAAAPRHGDTYVIAAATDGVDGRFANLLHTFRGALQPELRYGTNDVTLVLRAGSLAELLRGRNATELAFAGALDSLRADSYGRLSGLYGSVDLMDAEALGQTLAALAPTPVTREALYLQREQSRVMLDSVTDRLSGLGRQGRGGTISIIGAPEGLTALSRSRRGEIVSLTGLGQPAGGRVLALLPDRFSGFVSGGVNARASSFGSDRRAPSGQHAWHLSTGLEMEVGDGLTLGSALGHSGGRSLPGGEPARARSKVSQLAVYGAYHRADGAYLGGSVAVEQSRLGIERQAQVGVVASTLQGETGTRRYSAVAEAGRAFELGRGLTATPRTRLSYETYRMSGLRETGSEAGLQFDRLELERLQLKSGARLAGSAALGGGWTFAPDLQLDWVQNLARGGTRMNVRFANAPEASIPLLLSAEDRGWAEIKGQIRFTLANVEVGAGAEASLGRSGPVDNRAAAHVTLRF